MAKSRSKADDARKPRAARPGRDQGKQAEQELAAESERDQDTDVLTRLQQTVGNRAVARALQSATGPSAVAQLAHVLGPNAALLQRNGALAAAPVGRTVVKPVSRRTYAINARTLQEAVNQIQQRSEAGETTWNPTYQVTPDDSGQIVNATVEVQITVTMPSWPGASKLGAADKAKWDNFIQALEAHEQGHVDLVKNKLNDLGQGLLGKTSAEADAAFQAALQDLQSASDDYDAQTDHGRKTGTTIDLDGNDQPGQENRP